MRGFGAENCRDHEIADLSIQLSRADLQLFLEGATYQREEQRFNLRNISHLRLTIVPNKNGSGTATLTALRLFA
jgi:hypothetical protein